MKTILETERVSVDFDETNNRYRITTFDNNFHYDSELILDAEQMLDIQKSLRKLKIQED